MSFVEDWWTRFIILKIVLIHGKHIFIISAIRDFIYERIYVNIHEYQYNYIIYSKIIFP